MTNGDEPIIDEIFRKSHDGEKISPKERDMMQGFQWALLKDLSRKVNRMYIPYSILVWAIPIVVAAFLVAFTTGKVTILFR